jgi:AmmeMemoRadiSam system protein A
MQKLETLTQEEQIYLLKLARKSLVEYSKTGKKLVIDVATVPENLKCQGACFVTYHQFKQLRGCIGCIFPSRPLYQEVIAKSIDAAVHDPRFRPVSPSEVPNLELEISVLSHPMSVSSYDEIIIGTHGIILEKYGKQALFLPQVAPEQGWTLEETLKHLCLKATLSPDAWKKDCNFQVFTAQVFSEKQYNLIEPPKHTHDTYSFI